MIERDRDRYREVYRLKKRERDSKEKRSRERCLEGEEENNLERETGCKSETER